MIGNSIDPTEMTLTKTIAESQSPRTGQVLNNANSPGSAEELEAAKEVDGAMDMMVAMEPSSQCKLQDFSQIADWLSLC